MAEPNAPSSPPGLTAKQILSRIVSRIAKTQEDEHYWHGSIEKVFNAINAGMDEIQNRVGAFELIRSDSTVALQLWYSLPSILQEMGFVVFNTSDLQNTRLESRVYQDLLGSSRSEGSTPDYYMIYNNQITFEPIPNTAANTDAIDDADGITSTDVEVQLDSVASFPDRGRIKIDDEIMSYNDTATTGVGPTTGPGLKGLVRGLEGTTAATHDNDATVTLLNIQYFFKGYAPYLISGTLTGVPEIPVIFHPLLVHYGRYELTGDDKFKRDFEEGFDIAMRRYNTRKIDWRPQIPTWKTDKPSSEYPNWNKKVSAS